MDFDGRQPANLLLRDKDSFCVKVTDFGLSKSFEFKEKVAAASPPAKAADGSTSSPSPMQQVGSRRRRRRQIE